MSKPHGGLSDNSLGCRLSQQTRPLGHSRYSTNLHVKAVTMTFKTSVICALALSALTVTTAQAQTTTRAAVKAETAGGAASQPKGEMSVANQDKGAKPMASETSRAAVKSDAQAARAAGTVPMGEQSTPRQGKKPPVRTSSDKSRAQVKAEAAATNKPGAKPRGESSVVGQDKGGIKP